MAANDRGLSKARTEVSEWNLDRDWGFRGTKGYGIARNYYHRAERRFSKKLCKVVPVVDIVAQRRAHDTPARIDDQDDFRFWIVPG